MYAVYTKHRNFKRAFSGGIYTDDLDRAKSIADREAKSWWAVNGIYDWVKVRDVESKKYVYTAFAREE